MSRQTEREIEDVISKLTIGDKFTLYSKTMPQNNNKQYRLVSYEDDMVCVRDLDTLKICCTFENIQALRHHLLCSYDSGSICGCVLHDDSNDTNQMTLLDFKKELNKLKDGVTLHLYHTGGRESSYKLIMNWDYNAPYSVQLKRIGANYLDREEHTIRARNIPEIIDKFVHDFKCGFYCKCKVDTFETQANDKLSSGIHPIIVIKAEDKIDLIKDNSYIRLTDSTGTEYEYIVSINPEALYNSQIVSLHGVHKTDNNPTYSSLDELKRVLKDDIKNGKYTDIEVIQLSPIYDISNYTCIKPDKDWVKSCMTDEDWAKLSEPLKELNKVTESDVFHSYKGNEIIKHKEYGIGFTTDNTFVKPCSAYKSAPCMFWDKDRYKFLKKYCTQLNITPHYPTLKEIKDNRLYCFIILKNGNTFKYLLKHLSAPYMDKNTKKSLIRGRYTVQQEKNYNSAVVQIKSGEIVDIIFVNNKWFSDVKCYDIDMSDNTLIDTNTHKYIKEESKMKKIFVNQTTEKRVNKTNNTKYDVITTEVTVGNINGKVTLSAHDKNDTKMAIMYAICNAVVGGNFDTAYDRYLKHKQEEENPIVDRTCSYCGMIFNTIQEREEHEKLEHIEKRKARHERYLIRKEAKRRLAEMEQEKLDAEREKAIEAKMKEMQKAEKSDKKNK